MVEKDSSKGDCGVAGWLGDDAPAAASSMKRACMLVQLAAAGFALGVAQAQAAGEPRADGAIHSKGHAMEKKADSTAPAMARADPVEVKDESAHGIPAPAAWDEGFPIPAGARRNDALGGATSVAPGRNYTLRVYDTGSGIEAVTAFYAYHLADARRSSEGREVRFSTLRGSVRLAPLDDGTRITLAIGPR